MIWTVINAKGISFGPFATLGSASDFIKEHSLVEPLTLVQTLNGVPGSVRNVILTALEDAREAVRRG